jgi:hypothetical protein
LVPGVVRGLVLDRNIDREGYPVFHWHRHRNVDGNWPINGYPVTPLLVEDDVLWCRRHEARRD